MSLDDSDDDELEKQEKVVFGKSFGANDKASQKGMVSLDSDSDDDLVVSPPAADSDTA